MANDLNRELVKGLEEIIQSVQFQPKAASVSRLAELLKVDKDGYTYLEAIRERTRRSYSNDRVTQFLRHIARVLFFEVDAHLSNEYYWCELNRRLLVEVQVMLVEVQGDVHKMVMRESKLYVSYNTKSCVLYENDIIIDGKQRKFFSNETNKVKDIIKAKLEELLCSGQLFGLIKSHSGQPPEHKEGDSDCY